MGPIIVGLLQMTPVICCLAQAGVYLHIRNGIMRIQMVVGFVLVITLHYVSVLKLHAAGYLNATNGSLYIRGSCGYYWSSTQVDAANGWYLFFYSSGSSWTATIRRTAFRFVASNRD